MRRGDTFSELSTFNAGYRIMTIYGMDGDIIDLQSDKLKYYNGIRIDTYISSLEGMASDGILNIYLRHDDNIISSWATGVSLNDVVGPTYIGHAGRFKRLIGEYEGVPVTNMGNRAYGIVYVGPKRYVRIVAGKIDSNNYPVFVWCVMTGLHFYSGKHNRYALYGIDGGQVPE